jgi:hypothetical protein
MKYLGLQVRELPVCEVFESRLLLKLYFGASVVLLEIQCIEIWLSRLFCTAKLRQLLRELESAGFMLNSLDAISLATVPPLANKT